jgi:tRNA 2-selenouridine synthase SelU
MTLFTLILRTKNKNPNIYWVIQEAEKQTERILVKYFNDKNEVIFQEHLVGTFDGVIDENIVQKLNQTKKNILSRIA